MLIEIEKIKVTDRIRKDFGDISEFANDIKENGLINPPVVTPEYQLIAGERRLRAMKELGYKQVEVRIMTVQDALHQLKLEISENENRKDFTFSEKMQWAEQLKEEYSKIAKNNQLSGLNNQNVVSTTLDERESIRTDEAVARDLDMSKTNYRKAEYIYQNADEEMIKALDDNNLSINKAYNTLKERNQQLQQSIDKYKNQSLQASEISSELATKNKQLTIELNKLKDYSNREQNNLKSKINEKQEQMNRLLKEKEILIRKAELNDNEAKKYQELKKQIETLTQQKDNLSRKINSATELSGLTVEVKHYFDNKFAPIKYSRAIQELCKDDVVKQNLTEILDVFQGWIDEMNTYIKDSEFIDVEVL